MLFLILHSESTRAGGIWRYLSVLCYRFRPSLYQHEAKRHALTIKLAHHHSTLPFTNPGIQNNHMSSTADIKFANWWKMLHPEFRNRVITVAKGSTVGCCIALEYFNSFESNSRIISPRLGVFEIGRYWNIVSWGRAHLCIDTQEAPSLLPSPAG